VVGRSLSTRLSGVRARFDAADTAVAPVAVLVPLISVVFAVKDGGYAETVWLPGGVLAVALTGLTLWFLRPRVDQRTVVAIAGFAVFVVVLGLSVAWADVRGDAWVGADRALFYLLLFTLCALLPWRARTGMLALGVFGVGAAGVSLWQFLRVARYPVIHHDYFVAGRLAAPITYPNGQCALLIMAAFPLVLLAARREVPVLARGLFLAASGVAAELAILCQSRISLLAIPIVAVALIAVSGARARILLTALAPAVVIGLASPTLLDVYSATLDGPGAAELAHARRAILASAVALLVVGWAAAAADMRIVPSPRFRRGLGIAAAGVAVAAVAAAVVIGHRIAPHPIAFVRVQWDSFVSGNGYTDVRIAHFESAGTNRYDIWRVAVKEFRSSPIAGIGADNFAVPYLEKRSSASESPLYPHSNVLMVLSQTGVAGGLGFVVFVGAVLASAARFAGRRSATAAVGVAATAPGLYFLLHGLGDWFWEVPALGTAAVSFFGVAVALSRIGGGRAGAQVPRALVVGGAVVIAALFVLPWIAAREVSLASSGWPSNRALAYSRLDAAARFDPLSDIPAETEGLIAARSGDDRRARKAFARAIGRNSVNWYSRLELATVEARLDHRAAALAQLRRASELNPREPLVGTVRSRIAAGKPVSQAFVDKFLARESLA
jgi:hypothetical protein